MRLSFLPTTFVRQMFGESARDERASSWEVSVTAVRSEYNGPDRTATTSPSTGALTKRNEILFETLIVAQLAKKIPALYENLKIDYSVHDSPPLDTILSQMNPGQTLPSCFFNINFNIVLPSTPRSSKFSNQNFVDFYLSCVLHVPR
jgi:hypothetical protein